MVDYTTKETGGSGVALYLIAGIIVLVLLYAIFAGGGGTTAGDPASLLDEPAAAPVADDVAPVATE